MADATASPLEGANLENVGQNRRLRLGAAGLTVALAASVALVEAGAPRAYRLLLFLPFFGAAFGAWQGLLRTCPALARRGQREDHGAYAAVADPERQAADRRLGRRVLLASVITATVATALVGLLP